MQRQIDTIEKLRWSHACDTWSLLETLLEQDGFGWCPITNELVVIGSWTIGYVHCHCCYHSDDGCDYHSVGFLKKTWLFDLPNYSIFKDRFWQSDLGRWVHEASQRSVFPLTSEDRPRLDSCVVGDLFIDYQDRPKESWAIFQNPEIPLYNITHAPAELYERYGLKKPEVTGRRYHRYMLLRQTD